MKSNNIKVFIFNRLKISFLEKKAP